MNDPAATATSPLHGILAALGDALAKLGGRADPAEIERWGIALHQGLSSRTRAFHTPWHALRLLPDPDPLAVLAALFHDLVYVQVDLGLPPGLDGILGPFLAKEESGWRLLAGAAGDAVARDVLAVFGRQPGELLTPQAGFNELASALAAAKTLAGALSRRQLLALAACIEQTIPFRKGAPDALAARLAGLGLDAAAVRAMVVPAVRLANKDVGNFASAETARFLDHTWRLLPESNPALHAPALYSVRDYRVALMKMEEFLAGLSPERVFHTWGDEPAAVEHRLRVEGARRNIAVALRYLRAKLCSISVLEALADETGGDAPLELFMGGIPGPGDPPFRRAEQFLPQPAAHVEVDATLLHLLAAGREELSGFDTATSPLAAFLYRGLGETAVMAGAAAARSYWIGVRSARGYLERLPGPAVAAVARAAAEIAITRRAGLVALATELDGRAPAG